MPSSGNASPTRHAATAPPWVRPPNAVGKWERREETSTFVLSRYRVFWWGCSWQEFLRPTSGGFAFAKEAPACKAGVASLQPRPGVYEFAISKGPASQRFKVYVGETNSMARRHGNEYRQHGDHLAGFLHGALADGCTVWRRVRYTKSKQAAMVWELRFLNQFNYAWNQRCNAAARHVALKQVCCCCCARSVVAQYAHSAAESVTWGPPQRSPPKPLRREQFLTSGNIQNTQGPCHHNNQQLQLYNQGSRH